MTLRHLQIFIAVAQTENMTKAAKQMYLSQPTVSQAIRELEEHYDVLLFDRLSRRLYITEAGKNLLKYARPLIMQYEFLEQKMRTERQIIHLRIGATITISTCIMPELIQSMENEMPKSEIFVFTANTKIIEEKLLNGELDIAVVEGEITNSDLAYSPFADDYLVLVFNAYDSLAKKDKITFSDLEDKSFVMREQGSGTRALFEKSIRNIDFVPKIKIEAGYPQAMIDAVKKNNCFSVMSVRLLQNEINNKSIAVARSKKPVWNRVFKLVYHKDRPITPSIELFETLLQKYKEPFLKQEEIKRVLILR